MKNFSSSMLWTSIFALSSLFVTTIDAKEHKSSDDTFPPMLESRVWHKDSSSSSSSSSSRRSHHKPSCDVMPLQSSYPWEYIEDNVKTFKFVVMNFYTDIFNPYTVVDIAKTIESYVETAVFPSWRYKIKVEFFVPPSQQELIDAGVKGFFVNALPQPGTFIPVILTDNYSDNIPDNFATSVHGNVSASPTTGYNASLYIDGDSYTLTGPIPFGTPFIVIPAGSAESGNGINGQVAANIESGQGPTDFYQALSLVLSQDIISTLIDPTAARYVISGNPLGGSTGGPLPPGTAAVTDQIFYLNDATAPFRYGTDNTLYHNNWTVSNFALPAYFFPYNNSGKYDYLSRTNAPLTPYKGSQFVVYQRFYASSYPQGTLSDLLVGTNVSPIDDPANVQLVEGGSIYDYEGWGMQDTADLELAANEPNSTTDHRHGAVCELKTRKGKKNLHKHKHIPTVTVSNIATGRNRNAVQFKQALKEANETGNVTVSTCGQSASSHLLPFQYVDSDGVVVTRVAIINYISHKLTPAVIETTMPVMEKYIKEQFLPYWNTRVELSNYTVLPGDVGLPVFDGSFMAFFLLNLDQFDLDKIGGIIIGGGAYNACNVPNVVSGPEASEFLKATADYSVPVLPLGNPYLICSESNFLGEVTVTTDVPGLGPFTALPTISSIFIPTDFPIIAKGANANPINACSTLTNNLTGKIGVNRRTTCDSAVYPNNMANAGAIAFLTVFDPGAQGFSAPGAEIWGATMGAEGEALITALNSNPNITLTISAPVAAVSDVNAFTEIMTHEIEELSVDPSYGIYMMTFNPFVDSAVLFTQLETADQDERLTTVANIGSDAFAMASFATPAYFDAYLRSNNYDNIGVNWRALFPESRAQVMYHFESDPGQPFNPIHQGNVLGPVENGFDPSLVLSDNGSIFNPNTYYPPQNAGTTTFVEDTPLNTIYEALMNLRDVIFI